MATTRQLVFIGVLLTSSGAIWVPQLLGGNEGELPFGEETEGVTDPGADPANNSNVNLSSSRPGTSSTKPSSSGSTSRSTGAVGTPQLPPPTDETQDPDGDDLGSRSKSLFDSVAASLEGMENRRDAASGGMAEFEGWSPFGVDDSKNSDLLTLDPTMPAQEFLDAFLSANPVNAVLLGDSGGTALMGSKLVRPGTTLADGEIEVLGITREGVRVRHEDLETLHVLPPFRADGQSTLSSEEGESEEDPNAEPETSGTEGAE